MAILQPDQAKGQIEILLEEYRALRNDINGRISAQMTLLGVSGAGAAIFVGISRSSWGTYLAVGAGLVIVLASVWTSNNRWNHRLGERVGVIEGKVNELAEVAFGLAPADQLLAWQSGLNAGGGWAARVMRRLAGMQ